MVNAWLSHVAAFRKKNPNMSFKDVLSKAKATYKAPKKGKGFMDVFRVIDPAMALNNLNRTKNLRKSPIK